MTNYTPDTYRAPNQNTEIENPQLVGLQIVSMRMQHEIDRNLGVLPVETTHDQAVMIDIIAERPLKYAQEVQDGNAWQLNLERIKVLDQLMAYPELFQVHYADYLGMGDGRSHGSLAHEYTSYIQKWHSAYTAPSSKTAITCVGNLLSAMKYDGDNLSARARQQRTVMGHTENETTRSPISIIEQFKAPVLPSQAAAIGAVAAGNLRLPLTVKSSRPKPKPWYIPKNSTHGMESSWSQNPDNSVTPETPDRIVGVSTKVPKRIPIRVVEGKKPPVKSDLPSNLKPAEQSPSMPSKAEVVLSDGERLHLTKLWEENVPLPIKKMRTIKGREVSVDVMKHDLKDFTNKVQEEVANIMRRHRELGTPLDHIKDTLKPGDRAAKIALYMVRDMMRNNLQEA